MKIQHNKKVIGLLVAFAISQMPMNVNAGERESLEQLRATTINLIDLLVQEGVLSKSKADNILRQADEAKRAQAKIDAERAADANPDAVTSADSVDGEKDKVIRVQYVPEHVKKEIRQDIEKEVMANLNYKAGERLGLPDWIDRVKWKGDLRLRYQRDMFSDDNTPLAFFSLRERRNTPTSSINNTTEERDRLRFRTRFGMDINVNSWLTGELRIAAGGINNPTSATADLGTGQGISKFEIGLDRANLKVQLKPWLEMAGGRYANPYFSTDLVWDDDFAFDGIYAKAHPKINDSFSGFGVLGAHPIGEIDNSEINQAQDKWLFGAQAGLQWMSANKSSVTFAASYYDYSGVEGETNPLGNTALFAASAPATRQKGNNTFSINRNNNSLCGNGGLCGLASEFKEVNLTAKVDIAKFDPVHVVLTADYVRNIGFDQAEILSRTGLNYEEETDGYQLRLLVGSPEMKDGKNWQVFGGYKYLEADAVLDAFTDSNFHLGGTDSKGWILGGSYGLDKDAWLTARWFSANEISGLPLSIDVLLVDLNARF